MVLDPKEVHSIIMNFWQKEPTSRNLNIMNSGQCAHWALMNLNVIKSEFSWTNSSTQLSLPSTTSMISATTTTKHRILSTKAA